MRATIILVMALVIATPASCYKCTHRSSKSRHEFLVEIGEMNG
jgi:hypothetical protein